MSETATEGASAPAGPASPVPAPAGPVPAAAPARPARAAPRPPPDIEAGAAVIREQARLLPGSPGVYRMLDAAGEALYVGKARDLRRRVASYAQPARLSHRLFRMVGETAAMEVVVTHTEVEALLLESNLIKRLKPRYNVLMRDDKSFPHILITGDHASPRIAKHRGAQTRPGAYFGPFASAGAVNRTVAALQRAFLIRNCSDSVFASRARPCLQYQIKRCAAPCVDYVAAAEYDTLVRQARAFLAGESAAVQKDMAARMKEASDALDFETAALYRDRIRALTQVQARQDINIDGLGDADIFAVAAEGGASCVQVFFFRGGANYGNRAYFPSHDKAHEPEEILSAFIGQFYDNKRPPRLVLVNLEPPERALLAEALSVRAGRKVALVRPARGPKRKLAAHAETNAREALARRRAESASHRRMLQAVAEAFGLEAAPRRIEVYDNSHIQGTAAVGAMVVAGPEGFEKAAYRKFNIRDVEPPGGGDADAAPAEGGGATVRRGDDYAMMRQVLRRRFARAREEDPDRTGGSWPDLALIDGGRGQLRAAAETLAELGAGDVPLAAVSKGPDRDAGRERFHLPGRPAFSLPPRAPVLFYLQRLRDEAHRFAIETHRARRARAAGRSGLDDIPGVGARRKRALLHHFGSARAVSRAGLADLETVEGLGKAVARRVYDFFHEDARAG